jgi:hypothetical protein
MKNTDISTSINQIPIQIEIQGTFDLSEQLCLSNKRWFTLTKVSKLRSENFCIFRK